MSLSSSWVDCLVSIRFDLDIGPKIESIAPPDAITEEGKTKLLHCAFPDCNPDCGYNFIFYFTMPDCTTAAVQAFSQTVAPPTTGNTVPELYGAAFYRQKHDPKVPRRYVQQVVVLLSHLPYYNVHELILRVVAPRFCQCCPLSPDTDKVPVSSVLSPVPDAYFEVDHSYSPDHYTQDAVLREAMLEVAQWPSPHPQVRYTVTLLQQALVFLTPAHSLRQSARGSRNSYAVARHQMSVDDRVEFMEVARTNARYRGSTFGNDVLPLYSLLGDQLHHLTYVWELLLRHESLFILSNTPCVASATAFSVASLILPIQFNGTLRSYFTVQNEDFPRYSRMGKALPFPSKEVLIVAGTNPFLLRSFSGWPSLLVVMDRNTSHLVNGSVSVADLEAMSATGSTAGGGGGSRGTLPSSPAMARPASFTASRGPPLEETRRESPPLPVFGTAAVTITTAGPHTSTSTAPTTSGSFASSLGSGLFTAGLHGCPTGPVAGGLVTRVPASAGGGGCCGSNGIALSAQVPAPASRTTAETSASRRLAEYQADPLAAYALESSGSSFSSSSSAATSPASLSEPATPRSHVLSAAADSTAAAHALPPTAVASSMSGYPASTSVPLSANDRLIEVGTTRSASPAVAVSSTARSAGGGGAMPSLVGSPSTMPAPAAASVTLFTKDHYRTMYEAVHTVDFRKRGGGHQDTARTTLQQRLHNYFDSSVGFLLNHQEQTNMLLRRLEMVSLLDAEAQRASVSLSLHQWQGSPTTSSSNPWRHGTTMAASLGTSPSPTTTWPSTPPPAPGMIRPSAAATTATTTAPSSVAPSTSRRQLDATGVERGLTSCSHFSVADDILRKFFTSLTTEFLTPVAAWYQKATTPYTAFHLCDRALCDSLLSPASFLEDLAGRHRETVPSLWTQLHSYKTYKVLYERFAHGCLFKAYVCQLVDGDLRREMERFQVEEWVERVPSEAERIDLLINLLGTIQRELNETLDPDVLFVTAATSVMASMAVGLHPPHRDQFMLKIVDLKL